MEPMAEAQIDSGPERVFWLSPVPPVCQLCDGPWEVTMAHRKGQRPNSPIRVMFDATLPVAPGRKIWGNYCYFCFHKHGGQLGTGLGQRYEQQPDGKWLKVAG